MSEVFGSSPTALLPYLLLILITMMVSVIVCMFLVIYYLRNRRAASPAKTTIRSGSRYIASPTLIPGFIFERPNCWIAIRSRNLLAVRESLGIEDVIPRSWMEGLAEAAGGSRLFVSPPIRGWILVFGPHLPRPSDDIDQCFRFLLHLSQSMGEVQYFCGDSVTYEHAWARLVEGNVVRAYAWFRETLWNQGSLSEAERKTGMATYAYAESPTPLLLGAQDRFQMNTERLFLLAGQWSVDPSKVDPTDLSAGLGVSGKPSDRQLF